ncbi:RNA 2'-phosphotransferase [Bradyrhizobium commune]|uniref:Probable RNA 2'-phosphotransferase n=1 Tax=Bradyrhizobium commune TaxID=83627 RepID=A0A7S9H2D5_9BRAD|nr:RNA 2'-phosphotransferase [Bradyrhizobium commune]QPF94950.1 RNA 2'-phosphotransferase [Bradyrhizobium commune]
MPIDDTQLSKFLSLVLRHKPDVIGLVLDAQGWAGIDELIAKANAAGTKFGRDDLLRVVAASDKKRFSLSPGADRVRAAQGHSVQVELGLAAQEPPPLLYHGTATRFVEAILSEGLKPQARQQVHLSADVATAERVGQRHGKAYIFTVDTVAMRRHGYKFYRADNGVWLTDLVPPEFLAPITTERA